MRIGADLGTERHEAGPYPLPLEGRRRVVIDQVLPQFDGGRFDVKRVVGDTLTVQADAFPDGHDHICVRLLHRPPGAVEWSELPMGEPDDDRWSADLPLARVGRHEYTVAAWIDHFATWRHDLGRRVEADSATAVDMAIGAALVREAAERAVERDGERLRAWADAIDGEPTEPRVTAAMGDELASLIAAYPDRRFETVWDPPLAVTVDPHHARFGAWYELFPRSASSEPGRHGTFRDVIERLPYISEMGFDVLYLPPIHPIGQAFRKGPNNALLANPDDPGVPWAIGADEGGHMSVHPELGTLADFDALVAAAAEQGIHIALDLAFQASGDHPYLRDHPEWFRSRPDGTIQYAENPPKKYQDVYPLDFESSAWEAMWVELRSVTRFWMDHGVRIFRVDNPHTKPFAFWEWLINDIKATDPDVLFLAEAFTRPKVMYRLAKLGFSQSYTYFTWRNEKQELTEYLEEITRPPVSDFFRPNFFTNTPDILHAYLQEGGRAAFEARFVLAATLTPSYGIYGPPFELLQGVPREPGSEEYLDSEKYQLRHWDLEGSETIAPLITAVNRIRREHPALQSHERLWFLPTSDDHVIAYSKHTLDRSDVVLTVVNLDPRAAHRGHVSIPVGEYGLDPAGYEAHDLLGERRTLVEGSDIEFALDPGEQVAQIMRLGRLEPTAEQG
ncbi:MAG: alpha-1,4-glucan--maltose-1-phosphate maltosyltransferase [Candidatus Limnocylindrales bacterium]